MSGGAAGFGHGHAAGAMIRHQYGDAYLGQIKDETGKELLERGIGGYVVAPAPKPEPKGRMSWPGAVAIIAVAAFLVFAACWVYWENLPGEGF